MKSLLLLGLSLPAVLGLSLESSAPIASQPAATPVLAPRHCQVPCGIYGDHMRVDMILEDCATIEKGMKSLLEMDAEDNPSKNQIVRWVMNKDEHAQNIMEQISAYWLAQRIKAPKEAAGRDNYLRQLELLHGMTVSAMKCKQTTDAANVAALRRQLDAFVQTYFSKEDLEHLKEHGGGEHK